MEIQEKIIAALRAAFGADFVHLDDDDGISGFVVSAKFEQMPALDRQQRIDEALLNAAEPLSREERRRILMIAGLTPLEYESVGARIRVHEVRELGAGSLKVIVRGGYSDAIYVRGALANQKGVTVTEPQPIAGAPFLMSFEARGTEADPLTKARAILVLQSDPYIEVLQNALR